MTYRPNRSIPLHAYFTDEDGAKIAVSGTTGDTLDGSGADGTEVTVTVTRIDDKPDAGYSPVTDYDERPMLLADTSDAQGPLGREYIKIATPGVYEAVYVLTKGDLSMECSETFEVRDQTVS